MTLVCYRETCRRAIALSAEEIAALKRSGRSFWCPGGHEQHFRPGPDPKDAEIERLKKHVAFQDREASRLFDNWIRAEHSRDAFRAAWLDDVLGVYPAGVHEAPDGSRLWLAPCGNHGRFLDAGEEHVAFLLDVHVKRCGCNPLKATVEVTR